MNGSDGFLAQWKEDAFSDSSQMLFWRWVKSVLILWISERNLAAFTWMSDFHMEQNGKKIKEKIKEKIEEKINYLSCRLEGCFLEKLAVCLAKIAAVAGFDLLCFNLHCHWTKEWHLSCCHHHAESSKWNSVCLAILLSKTSFHLSDPPKSPRFFIPVRFRLWMKVSFSKSLCWRFLSSNGKNHLNSWVFSHLVN